MTRPRLLDLFCGAGGAAMGYHQAGFDVVGVDINPQPHYPFEFHRLDALEVLETPWMLRGFDAIHASPPCQAYSAANNIHQRTDHPDLIPPVRAAVKATGLPYIIENVPRSPLQNYVVLCGLSFPGLNVKRHRWFECSFPVLAPPCGDHSRDYLIVFGGSPRRRAKQVGRTPNDGPMLRREHAPLSEGLAAMGIDWMTCEELDQAIPPAYTHYLGGFLLDELGRAA